MKSFDELTDNPVWREELRRVYGNDIEKVDLMTGLYAEPLPEGFGFSDTAFRIFVLMASRRLKSDRFFTDDFSPAIYTEFGIDYIRNTTMLSILARHFPDLEAGARGRRECVRAVDAGAKNVIRSLPCRGSALADSPAHEIPRLAAA